ncbi:uncharacterized protein BJX67DRAFT_60875 [Aspergillus lucknowensis]|uniref:NAD-dependent epimerase/dehydratase domain-containing protein n=1 Tax=Aspergillus lucknowensis TaxID=176173 RepID=A0ABR4LU98_9EURO
MSRILVTGGSVFLANALFDILLTRGHSVVTTVRTPEKAQSIHSQCPNIPTDRLSCKIVPDIANPSAFDDAVICDPPLSAVIHTASPFHYSISNAKRDKFDPAVNGIVGILQSVRRHAPSVQRVLITSSFAAKFNPPKPAGSKYSEEDWNPVTWEDAENPENAQGQSGYRTSKTLAEKEAWKFMEEEKPAYTLTVENPETAGKRHFLTSGNFCNAEIVEAIGLDFPELKSALPSGGALGDGEQPPGGAEYGYDRSALVNELGLVYRSLQESVVDTVESLNAIRERTAE